MSQLKSDNFTTNNAWLSLPYLLIAFFPWFGGIPSTREILLSFLLVVAFIPLHFATYRRRNLELLPFLAANCLFGAVASQLPLAWTVFLVYAAAGSAFVRPTILAAALVVSAALITSLIGWLIGQPMIYWIPGSMFCLIIGFGAWTGSRLEEANYQLRETQSEMRRLAVTAERERIARDLHDLLGHTLSVLAVKADLARRLMDSNPAAVHQELEDIQQTARDGLRQTRQAVAGMREGSLKLEIAQARHSLAAAAVEVTEHCDDAPLPDDYEAALAMVMRESATNVLRHAKATECHIALTQDDDELQLSVCDNGRGDADLSSKADGNGLRGMRERLIALGGRLTISSSHDRGTSITACLPLPQQGAET